MEPRGSAGEQPLRSAPSLPPDGESDERFRTIFERAPEAILVLDVDTGQFVEANQRVRELLGYTAEETRELTAVDVSMEFQADGRPAAEAATGFITETMEGGKPNFPWLLKHKAGHAIEAEVRMTRMPPFEKHLVLGAVTDLRERNAAARELAQREAEFRTLAENSPDWIVRVDRDLRRVYVNPAVAAASGTRPEDLVGKTPTESFPGSPDMEAWEEGLRKVFETGEPQISERETNLGDQRVMQTSIVPEFDEGGQVVTALSVTRDVTSVRRAVEAEMQLAEIVESAADAIMSSDLDGVIQSWNPGAERLFGYSAEYAIGQTTAFLFETGNAGRNAIRDRLLLGETIDGLERDWRRADGTMVTTSSVFFPLRAADGTITGTASIARDITEERRAARRLAESERRLRVALQTARMGAWTYNPGDSSVVFTPEMAAIYQRRPEEMPRTMRESIALFHPDDQPNMVTRLRDADQLDQMTRQFRIRMPDDSYRWMAGVGNVATGDDGTVSGVVMDIHERKEAEDALRESENRFRQVVESVSAGIWVFDGSQIALVNAALERMTGFTREELQQPEFFSTFISPEQVTEMRARAQRRMAGGAAPEIYEVEVIRADGQHRFWELAASRIDFHGAPASIVSAFDVTERRQGEAALRESETRFRHVVETVTTGIWIWDGEKIVQVNRALERITGYTAEQFSEPGFLPDIIHAEDFAIVRERTMRAEMGEQGLPPAMEIRMTAADGSLLFLELSASLTRLSGQRVWLNSVFDITERKLAEDALRESEARFRSLVDNSPDFITRVDRELRYDFVNATAQSEAGLDPSLLLGKRADEIEFFGELAEFFMKWQREVFATGHQVEYEYTINSRATPEVTSYRRTRLVPEFDESGNIHHLLSIVTDITAQRKAEEERKRLDQQMQHAQKLESLGVLAGGIAHDFNNLLVAMLGNAGLALMELPPESPARQTVQAIELAAQRASELTRQMLAYSGKGRFIIEPLNLSRIVEEMAHLLEVSVSKRAVLKYHFTPNLPAIEGDATQVRQVIMNLIINASDALGDGPGGISITTGKMYADHAYLASSYIDGKLPEGDYVFLEVADTGIGMDEETRARIFDPFFTTKFTGRGLGLAAVLGIVRGHQGAIRLYSEVGRGTTFKVLFPVSGGGAGGAPEPVHGTAEPQPGGRTLLVVDDDDTVRAVTRRILEHAGFTVILGADGQKGVDLYRENPGIAMVLLDMTMPHMDGEETFRELRRLDPAVRVLLTSGYSEQDATERFVGKGLSGFIQKPYRPQELLDKIYEALGEA